MSEVEKAKQRILDDTRRGLSYCEHAVLPGQLAAYAAAVRAEAIAETEAKFRALAEKWKAEAKEYDQPDSDARAILRLVAVDLESLLTPCPQSRHDAGESESK